MVQIRAAFDVISTLVVAVAAGVLLWRTTASERSPVGREPPRVERVDGSNLRTSIAGAVTRGDAKASIVMIEYADFQCPFCGKFARETFDQIDRGFISSGLVQYAFRNFPLEDIHPVAMDAAKAAECASHDGRFWEMREQLFANQAELAKISWLELASRIGIDSGRYELCLRADETQDAIVQERSHAESLGVSSTPTFLIGVKKRDGSIHILTRIPGAYPYEVFERELNEALTSTKQATALLPVAIVAGGLTEWFRQSF